MKKILVFLFSGLMALPTLAFESDAERIEHYLKVLKTHHFEAKNKMLNRLEWSGLTQPELFDYIEQALLNTYDKNMSSEEIKLSVYMMKALWTSGQEKYRPTINLIKNKSTSSKLSRYAKNASVNLGKFGGWHQKIAQVKAPIEGKPAEIEMYMRMLTVDDIFVQRLAARAMFHENQRDADLVALAAEKLQAYYMDASLDGEAQDTVAWLCKAVGQSRDQKYSQLLNDAAQNSPHRKIQKYARKFSI